MASRLTDQQLTQARDLRQQRYSIRDIADQLGVPKSRIEWALSQPDLTPNAVPSQPVSIGQGDEAVARERQQIEQERQEIDMERQALNEKAQILAQQEQQLLSRTNHLLTSGRRSSSVSRSSNVNYRPCLARKKRMSVTACELIRKSWSIATIA